MKTHTGLAGKRWAAACWLAAAGLAAAAPLQIRVATFNASLNRNTANTLWSELGSVNNGQAKKVAEIIQRVRPDVVLINEFDYDTNGLALARFHNNYLAVSQSGQPALSYPYRYTAPSNTGIPTGKDLDNAGGVVSTPGNDAYGGDCYGFGWFPGQYGMAVYSKYPIDTAKIRTFQFFLWKDMPNPAWPDQPGPPFVAQGWYSQDEKDILRLSSKSHWDVPIILKPGQVFHLLASHPTPPSFDSTEDRNGHRNHDEIRLWADYISGAPYIYDDARAHGGLPRDERFVILGDLNADPLDGDSYLGAINQLRQHPLVDVSVDPSSPGPLETANTGVNRNHRGNPAFDTGDFNDNSVGNLRIDHVLPSKTGFKPTAGGVFWPASTDPLAALVAMTPTVATSDHRMVWLDMTVTPVISQAVRGLAVEKSGDGIRLVWTAQDGVTYRVQQSADMADWTVLPVTVAAGSASATDAGPLATAKRFYRVVVELAAP